MTDRDFVESTVTYLAEHVPWMWVKFRRRVRLRVPRRYRNEDPCKLVEDLISEDGRHYSMDEGYLDIRNILQLLINPKCHPLVSADWWEERGESKLAELLRKQNKPLPPSYESISTHG